VFFSVCSEIIIFTFSSSFRDRYVTLI